MSREEFEAWLEEHQPEALDRIEGDEMPLTLWVALLGASLKNEAKGEPGSDTRDDDTEVDAFD